MVEKSTMEIYQHYGMENDRKALESGELPSMEFPKKLQQLAILEIVTKRARFIRTFRMIRALGTIKSFSLF